MDQTSLSVRKLAKADAAGLARLRISIDDRSLPARLGPPAVEAFFRAASAEPDTFGLVADHDGEPIGFIICTTASVRLQRQAIRSDLRLWLRAAWMAVRDPGVLRMSIGRLAILVRPPRADTYEGEPRLRLFDIAVALEFRSCGVGRSLVAAALDEARKRGFSDIGLTVLSDNTPAIRLYEWAGFELFRAGVRADGRAYMTMRCMLDRHRTASESAR